MTLIRGVRIGSYEIVAPIGRGGMGEVYRATDHKLGRDVALKVLKEEVASNTERLKRFEQEARSASALNHPNIVTIHDIGMHRETPYVVMELIEGEPLRAVLDDGPLPMEKLLDYGIQTAHGLTKAHGAGIIHRDLKPENIMVTEDGFVKILDFGLAKLLPDPAPLESETPTATKWETAAGMIMGTVGYMSPEQARGGVVDHRSDQFSLGLILYEMATGKSAFHRETAVQTLAAVIEDEPESISRINPDVPKHLQNVVNRCLAKKPDDRYDETGDITKDLEKARAELTPAWTARRWLGPTAALATLAALLIIGLNLDALKERFFGTITAPPPIESLAVLPLDNLSGDPEQEYFADGMTDALIANLAQIKALRVISRQSVMRFKNSDVSLPEIARTLDVDAVIEGSVLRAGNRVRITTQLVRAEPEEHLWAESYERELKDVLALQNVVAGEIAREVRVTLTSREQARLEHPRTVDPQAHELYLRALFGTDASSARTKEVLQQAIDKDPTYAPAYAALADIEVFGLPSHENMPKARAHANKALELDRGLAEAHTALAMVKLYYDWDWQGAEEEFVAAIDLDPNSSVAHHRYTAYLWATRRLDEALSEIHTARTLDPLSPWIGTDVGRTHYFARRYDQAIAHYERVLKMGPNFYWARFFSGIAYEQMKKPEEAAKAIIEARRRLGQDGFAEALAKGYEEAGYEGFIKAWLEVWEHSSEERPQPTSIAMLHARLGNLDQAFHWLEKGLEERTRYIVYLEVEPQFDNLRSDPRFDELVQRMRFPENNERR